MCWAANQFKVSKFGNKYFTGVCVCFSMRYTLPYNNCRHATAITITTYRNKTKITQGAYKFGKIKCPEFSRHSKQSFPYNYKVKTRCNKSPRQSFWYTFVAELQNVFLRSMVTGSTLLHVGLLCVTDYVTNK